MFSDVAMMNAEDTGVSERASAARSLSSEEARDGPRYLYRMHNSVSALRSMAGRGYDHWIVTFSGGKDSTTTLVIALETALACPGQVQRIGVVYSDTMIEIPVVQRFALGFLEHLGTLARVAALPMRCHAVYPAVEERFWACLIGRGYPPPHQRFRWCTRRLKAGTAIPA